MLNTASLINLLGFAVGLALYLMLFLMVFRHRQTNSRIDLLLLLTAILGILWNAGELFQIVWKDFFQISFSPLMVAISYSALGFLPSVVVHSSEKGNTKKNYLTLSAYLLSVLAAILHIRSAVIFNVVPSNLALNILTLGSFALIAGLLLFNFKQRIENKTVLITALLIFAFSALHLSSETEENFWLIELVAHQSSLPLVLVILFQDYRFAFADLFLKRALSFLFLSLTAFTLYVFAASPLMMLHISHQENDALETGILLLFWIMTALLYPLLHKFSGWLVDKIILKRINYEELQKEIAGKIENYEKSEFILDEIKENLKRVLTAKKAEWSEIHESRTMMNLPAVEYSTDNAELFVPTNESPFYKIYLKDFSGGRKLLSEEIAMLEAVSLLVARKIDSLRVTDERFEQEMREQTFTKLATEAQLMALRSQINPHFLFNALTTIGYLINTAPETAFQTLMKLTQLLRKVLKSNGEFCTLGDEISLIENYLDIEKARFEERLQIEIDIPESLRSLRIPSLIMQPLVENAVKHGISENKNGGLVKISANLENTANEVFLNLRIYDSGAGHKLFNIADTDGIGLQNIRQRLETYYGQKSTLKIESEPNQGTTARLRFPVKLLTIGNA